MHKKIKFAIIGCGRIAERHAMQISALGELVAVCDIAAERAKALGEKYGAACFFSTEELFAAKLHWDVTVVCTPNALHAAHSISALANGYHVLVEKPMALTADDCNRMIDAAGKAGKHLFTVMQNRFNPPVTAVKKALDANAFGKLSSIQLTCFWNRNNAYYSDTWKGTKHLDGGTLFTQFSHFIDLLYWFFGEVTTVHAITQNSHHEGVIEFEDCGVVIIAFTNGVIGTINFSVNSFGENREGSLTILGKKGMAKIGGAYLNTVDYQVFENYTLETSPGMPPNDYGAYKGSMSNHDKVYQNIIDTLQQGKPYYADSFDGLKTVEIIERIYRSAESGNP